MGEQEKNEAWDRGYLIAVANLVNMYGAGTEAEELLRASGITRHRINSLDLTDYDRRPLDRLARRVKERDRVPA